MQCVGSTQPVPGAARLICWCAYDFQNKEKIITLDEAARLLIGGEHADDKKVKSMCGQSEFLPWSAILTTFKSCVAAKVRRLYDIANIFFSLKLIRKFNMSNVRGRKPAFEWVGCDLDGLDTHSARPSASGRGSKKSNSENIAPAGMWHFLRRPEM